MTRNLLETLPKIFSVKVPSDRQSFETFFDGDEVCVIGKPPKGFLYRILGANVDTSEIFYEVLRAKEVSEEKPFSEYTAEDARIYNERMKNVRLS